MRASVVGLTFATWVASAVAPGQAQTRDPDRVEAPAPVDETEQGLSPGGDDAAVKEAAPAAAKAGSDASADKAKADEAGCNPAVDVCLVADKQGREKGHLWARGFADLRMGELRIQADALDIHDVVQGGVTTQRVTAEGNVVLLRGQERMAGTKMSMDLDTGRGTMDDVVGYAQPGVFFTAQHIERVDSKTFRIRNGRFTSCCQPKPRWSFTAPRATLKVGDRITASAVHFNLGVPLTGLQVPALFVPYFVYPIKEDDRATGLLFPSFNIQFGRGVDIRPGFFLTMGRSADQTFALERRARMGLKLIHELRWAADGTSRGALRTTFFPPSKAERSPELPPPNEDWDFDFDWNAQQLLPGGIQARVKADVPSSQEYLTAVGRVYNPVRRFTFTLQKTFARQSLQIQADSNERVFSTTQSKTRRMLPRISLSQAPRGIGHSGVRWEYMARFDRLNRVNKGVDIEDPTAAPPPPDAWTRFDFTPALSRPISWSFLSATPRLSARYTHYSKSCPVERPLCGKLFVEEPLTRQSLEGGVDVSGPQFSRIFRGPAGFSDLIKHVIGLELNWVYREATDNYGRVPQFRDEADNTARAHELRYGLVQQLWGRRKTATGESRPFEFLSWSLQHKRYFWDPQTPRDRDFNTQLFREGDTQRKPIRYSPIRSLLKLSPAPQWSFDWLQEYDVNRKATTRLELGADIRGALGRLRANWSRSPAIYEGETELAREINDITASADLAIGGKWLSVGAALNYGFVEKMFITRSVHMRLDAQCIALLLDYSQMGLYRDASGKQLYANSFGFAIELANLGSIGMDPGRAGGMTLGTGRSGGLR